MLTGDAKITAARIADDLGVDAYYAELLPDQKIERLERIAEEKMGKAVLCLSGMASTMRLC
ncbi:MAG: hypothetical protein LBV68_07805 [Spirochaetaceae bacterium]|jgi:Cd2+/Zn2+-exporting ATPase|nr:hypothetical protein [Spirochaetaceae bacterium]